MKGIRKMKAAAVAMGALAVCGCVSVDSGAPFHLVDDIANCDRYVNLNPHFPKAFAFLKRTDLATLPVGRYEIDGDNCWAMVQEVELKPLAERLTEAHRKYIDIQAPLSDDEVFGFWTMSEGDLARPFDGQKDIVLFKTMPTPHKLRPGRFAVFFPPLGAHAPCCTDEAPRKIRKLVIKVKAETAANR